MHSNCTMYRMQTRGLTRRGTTTDLEAHTHRRAARRGQGGRLPTLNFRPGAVTTLNLGHVSIFYQVIFPVNKQGSIESPPRKQRLENDAKEREKQTIVAKKNQLRRRYTIRFARTEPVDCPVHGSIVTCGMSLECPGHVKIG